LGFFSLFFFLGLLEIGLRIAGHFYFRNQMFNISYRRPRGPEIKDIPGSHTVLCVGDSFTRGDEVPYDKTYPGQLAKLINQKTDNKEFVVINQGICGYNSRQLLKFLPSWIKHYKPDSIILLVGATNRFNPWGYNLHSEGGIFSSFKNMICDLRISKMIKIISLNLKGRRLHWDSRHILAEDKGDAFRIDGQAMEPTRSDIAMYHYEKMEDLKSPIDNDPVSLVWLHHNNGRTQQALQLCHELLQTDPYSPRVLFAMGCMYLQTGKHQEAAQCYESAFRHNPNSEFALNGLVHFYREMGDIYVRQGRYGLAIESFLRAIELDPREYDNYYMVSKVYDLQSKYDSVSVFGIFQKMIKANPHLKNNRLFMNYLNLFKDKQDWEAKISKWMEQDLEKIARLCHRKNVRLIIQNYPVSYPMANKVLEEVARRHSLAFVENCAVFNYLTSKEKREVYFFDDDHCTPQGHRVMAANIYKTLVKEGIVLE